MVVFLHHGGDSIDEDPEFLHNLLVDVQVLCPFQGEESLVVVSVLNLDLRDLIDGSGDCPFVGVVLDGLFIANDGVVGLF